MTPTVYFHLQAMADIWWKLYCDKWIFLINQRSVISDSYVVSKKVNASLYQKILPRKKHDSYVYLSTGTLSHYPVISWKRMTIHVTLHVGPYRSLLRESQSRNAVNTVQWMLPLFILLTVVMRMLWVQECLNSLSQHIAYCFGHPSSWSDDWHWRGNAIV